MESTTQSKHCTRCGAANPSEAAFCASCGAPTAGGSGVAGAAPATLAKVKPPWYFSTWLLVITFFLLTPLWTILLVVDRRHAVWKKGLAVVIGGFWLIAYAGVSSGGGGVAVPTAVAAQPTAASTAVSGNPTKPPPAAPTIVAASGSPSAVAAAAPTATSRPAPTATPVPNGTRQNPVPMGQVYTFKRANQVFTVQVLEVQRNALSAVKKANQFNEDPTEGTDYILVKVRLAYVEGSQDKPMRTTGGEHRFYADNRFHGEPLFSVPPKPSIDGQDIFPGATVDGWLAGKLVPKGAMNEAVLVYDNVYFALK